MSKTTYRFCKDTGRLVNVAEIEPAPVEPKYDPSAMYDEYLNGPRSGTFRRCQACGDFHEVSNWPANHLPEQYDLAHEYAGIATISDSLENHGLIGVQNQADGKFYTSKSKLRADYRARGMIEVGTDPQRFKPFQKPKPDRAKIKEALHRAHYAVANEGARVENFVRQRKAAQNGAFGRVNPVKSAQKRV
jgi:hypothetical protein